MNVVSEHDGSALRLSRPGRFDLVLLLAVSAAVSGCSALVDPDTTQCKVDDDCIKRFGEGSDLFCRQNVCVAPSCSVNSDCQAFGAAYAGTICTAGACVPASKEPPEWLCLDEPAPAPTGAGPFTVHARAIHIVKQTGITGAAVRICRKLDAACTTPEATATTDANGEFTVTLAKGFSGYVSLSHEGLMTTEYFLNPAININTELGSIQMSEAGTAAALAGAGGAALMAGRGLLLLSVQNCEAKAAIGIQFSSADADATTTPFYAIGGLPSKTATETDTAGFGGFINVLPGFFTIEGKRSSDKRLVGRFGVQVKSDTLVMTRLVPSVLQ